MAPRKPHTILNSLFPDFFSKENSKLSFGESTKNWVFCFMQLTLFLPDTSSPALQKPSPNHLEGKVSSNYELIWLTNNFPDIYGIGRIRHTYSEWLSSTNTWSISHHRDPDGLFINVVKALSVLWGWPWEEPPKKMEGNEAKLSGVKRCSVTLWLCDAGQST